MERCCIGMRFKNDARSNCDCFKVSLNELLKLQRNTQIWQFITIPLSLFQLKSRPAHSAHSSGYPKISLQHATQSESKQTTDFTIIQKLNQKQVSIKIA